MRGDAVRLVGTWRITMRDAASGLVVRERAYHNIACVNGKAYIAQWLNGENPALSPTTIYGAVGSLGGSVSAADTSLNGEIDRMPLATSSRSVNVTTFDFFYPTGRGNGTWAEAGLFLGASGAIGAGMLLSHVLVSETKTSSITATLEFTIQIG